MRLTHRGQAVCFVRGERFAFVLIGHVSQIIKDYVMVTQSTLYTDTQLLGFVWVEGRRLSSLSTEDDRKTALLEDDNFLHLDGSQSYLLPPRPQLLPLGQQAQFPMKTEIHNNFHFFTPYVILILMSKHPSSISIKISNNTEIE